MGKLPECILKLKPTNIDYHDVNNRLSLPHIKNIETSSIAITFFSTVKMSN